MVTSEMEAKSQIYMTQNIRGLPTILDIDKDEFQREAMRLLSLARREFSPDILLGIRSGGYFLAQAMATQAGESPPALVPITRRRASTRSKERLNLKRFVGRAPRSLKDVLRRLEHRYLMMFTANRVVERVIPDPVEDQALRRAIEDCGENCRILIVDDAVDSGATLLAVARYVREVAGERADIRSAVITVTYAKPLIEPDFTLYRQILCRFYWSSDFA